MGLAAAILSPGFREGGVGILTAIIGGYVTIIGGAGIGTFLARDIRKQNPPEKEDKE